MASFQPTKFYLFGDDPETKRRLLSKCFSFSINDANYLPESHISTFATYMHTNCRSLNKCISEIDVLLNSLATKLTLLYLLETRLDENQCVLPQTNYKGLQCPRSTGKRGCGVSILCADNYKALCINLIYQKHNILIICFNESDCLHNFMLRDLYKLR